MRNLSSDERRVLREFCRAVDPSIQGSLERDIEKALVDDALSSDALTKFSIVGYDRPPYVGQRSYGIEGAVKDFDGADLVVDLFHDQQGRLLEMEIIRYDYIEKVLPDWKTFIIKNTMT